MDRRTLPVVVLAWWMAAASFGQQPLPQAAPAVDPSAAAGRTESPTPAPVQAGGAARTEMPAAEPLPPHAGKELESVEEQLGLTMTTDARFFITHRDRGIESTDADRVEPDTSMGLETFRITFEKVMSPRYQSRLTLNFLERRLDEGVEEALLLYRPNRIFAIAAGKGKILQAGYETFGDKIGIALESLYVSRYLPFYRKFGSILELHTQANGDLTLQLTPDVSNQEVDQFGEKFPYFSNVQKQPAVVIQWLAKFGKIVPLIQIGSYDLNHSAFVTGGVMFNLAGVKVSADMTADNRAERIKKASNPDPQALNHRMVNKVFQFQYTSYKSFIPFAKWSSFAISQPEDRDFSRVDLQANSTRTSWDDNQSSWQIGTHTIYWGTEFVPFLAYSQVSGKFYREGDRSKIDNKSEMMMTAGVSGKF